MELERGHRCFKHNVSYYATQLEAYWCKSVPSYTPNTTTECKSNICSSISTLAFSHAELNNKGKSKEDQNCDMML